MNASIPKQFLVVNRLPLIFHTITAFHRAIPEINIILVLPENQIRYFKKLCSEYNFSACTEVSADRNEKTIIAKGGKERFHSVKNGLVKINENGIVAVHDGVRPFVSEKLIARCFSTAEKKGNAIPATAVRETLRKINKNNSETSDRNQFVLIQTPQCFQVNILKKAYLQKYNPKFTDDASVVENLGIKINLVVGDEQNIKITTPYDFEIAETMMKKFGYE